MTIYLDSPSVLVDCQSENAENPLWHPHQQCLYWTDIPAGKMFRYNRRTNTYSQIYTGESVGGFTIQTDGKLLLFKTKGTVEIWDEGKTTTVVAEIPAASNSRFNDAIADPEGRVYSGTMATENALGKLYRFELDGSYQVVAENFLIPNGMGFDAEYKYLYVTDSERLTIYRFDYNRQTGNLSNQQPYIVVPENQGEPDGLTIDAAGYIWSARWDGNHVYRYNLEGKEDLRIKLPVRKVSCITFGGENYDRLFISTARDSETTQTSDRHLEAMAGNIFHLTMKIQGRPEFLSRINLA